MSTETTLTQTESTTTEQNVSRETTETVKPEEKLPEFIALTPERIVTIDRLIAAIPADHVNYSFVKNAFSLFAAVQSVSIAPVTGSMPNPQDEDNDLNFTVYTVTLSWAIVSATYTVTWFDNATNASKPKFVSSKVNLPEVVTIQLPGLPLSVAASLVALQQVAPTNLAATIAKLADSVGKSKLQADYEKARENFISTVASKGKTTRTTSTSDSPKKLDAPGSSEHSDNLADSLPAELVKRLIKNCGNVSTVDRMPKVILADFKAGAINVPANYLPYVDGYRAGDKDSVKWLESFVDDSENYATLRSWIAASPTAESHAKLSLLAAAKLIQTDMRNKVSNVEFDLEIIRPIYDLLRTSDRETEQCACDYGRKADCKNPSKHGEKLAPTSANYVKTCVASLNAKLASELWSAIPQTVIDAWAKLS